MIAGIIYICVIFGVVGLANVLDDCIWHKHDLSEYQSPTLEDGVCN